ncbi:hypothetical protein Tco_0051626 [Tanacetum coccineum]
MVLHLYAVYIKEDMAYPCPKLHSASTKERSIWLAKLKVIKKESKVLGLFVIDDDLFTCDTPLGTIFDEFNQLSGMDDDLFTYEVKIPKLSYFPSVEQQMDDLDKGTLMFMKGKCAMMNYKVNAAEGVNAVSEEVSTTELLKEFDLLKWDQQVVPELVALRNFAKRYGSRFYTHDYALWEVIENGATLPKTTVVEGVEKVMPITSAEDKAQRRLEVKARSTLMIGIPNEHQLKFNSIKDAKLLVEAVKKRFGGNAATKKTQRNLLKHLSPEWNTHAVVWRNKAELETMSMDDLYNNLKVYEPEVKGMSSSSSSTQNMAFMSSSNNNTSNTNEAVNATYGVTTASTQVNKAPGNQDNKNKESSRRSVPVETSTSTTLVSGDGLGGYNTSCFRSLYDIM